MALKPTIYKSKIMLSDLDRHYYDSLNLTIARHPSETLERMMIRVLAFCIHAQDHPEFAKGLSDPDEPDLWARSLDNKIHYWIEVGEPSSDRIRKASRIAEQVVVFSFNSRSPIWWRQEGKKIVPLPVRVFQVAWNDAQALAALAHRTMDLSVTISDSSAYISAHSGNCEISWSALTDP